MRHGSEVEAQQIPALRLLRRGLAASPELRKGAALTLALALVAGGGRVITPVLVQQTIDRHISAGPARLSGVLTMAGAGVLLILVAAWAARTTNKRLALGRRRPARHLRAVADPLPPCTADLDLGPGDYQVATPDLGVRYDLDGGEGP